MQRAIEYATVLQVPQLNCLCGIPPQGLDDATVRRTVVTNLKHAAAELKAAGLRLLIEPVNRYDVPGFWLDRTDLAISVLDEVGADNAFVQYDVYHAQRTEGELAGHVVEASGAHRPHPGGRQSRASTSRAAARSTTISCSRTSTASATRAMSAANTNRPAPPKPGSAGWNRRAAICEPTS